MHDEHTFYAEAFSRNIGLLTEAEQALLRHSTVAIAGLGGVGGIFALSFARLGVGRFNLSDPDTFATVNINRQAGAMVSTVDKPKAEVVANMIKDINPHAVIQTFSGEGGPEELDQFLNGATVVIDAIDFFCIAARRTLYACAREHGLVVMSAGPVGFGSAMQVFNPHGMSFDEYFDLHDDMSEDEMILHFGIGVTPTLLQRAYFRPDRISLSARAAPSVVSGTLLAANLITCEAAKLILGRDTVRFIPHSSHFDPYVRKYKTVHLRRGNRGLLQRLKIWYVKRMLANREKVQATSEQVA